jgi:endonuclease/exonuclease/phosphatase family metal-dependent hydrolase
MGAIGATSIKMPVSLAAFPAAIALSSLGALCLKISGTPYLLQRINDKGAMSKGQGLLLYNIGLLPGSLAQEMTVSTEREFGMTHKRRRERLVSDVIERFQSREIVVLQEAVDFGFIQLLKEQLETDGHRAYLYSRITGANPLVPGIASGLCLLSHEPLEEVKVGRLPRSEPLFNRAFIAFRHKGRVIVSTHLRDGGDDDFRMEQLASIVESIRCESCLIIGDLNFTSAITFNEMSLTSHMPFAEPTLRKGGGATDMVATYGNAERPRSVHICKDAAYLSDHYPIELDI